MRYPSCLAWTLWATTALLTSGWQPIHAQSAQAGADVALHGRVVTADNRPLPGAMITVHGALPTVRTGDDGRFDLALPARKWWIVARHIGYSVDSAEVDLPTARDTVILLVLRAAPQSLRGITVEAERSPLDGATISPETMRNVPPLGEADVFRTLVLLPGVSQPNDLQGQLHLAGASADETGVRIDGHPLQQPFHVFGALGAFNVASLDEATVRVHRLPIDQDGSLGGVVDLRTRRKRPDFNREFDLSLASGSGAWVSEALSGAAELLVSGRVTYLNQIARALKFGTSDGEQPSLLGFADGLVALRVAPNGMGELELLGFGSNDRRGPNSGARTQPFSWGETLVGARWTGSVGQWSVVARADRNVASASHRPAIYSDIDYLDISQLVREFALQAERTTVHWRAIIGAIEEQRDYQHLWRAPGATNPMLTTRTPSRMDNRSAMSATTAFGQITAVAGGTRGALGIRSTMRGGRTYLAPRASVDRQLAADLQMGVSLERRVQHTTYLEEPREGAILQPSYILERPKRADVASIAFRWRGGNRPAANSANSMWPQSVDLTFFARSFPDRPILRDDPRAFFWAQLPLPDDFPRFERVPARAAGLTLTVLQPLPHRGTAQLSYAAQRVTERVNGVDAPAQWDAPHALTAFFAVPFGRSWSASAVMQFHSGVATTPIASRIFAPREDIDDDILHARYIEGGRNSARLPGYQRLDLALRHVWHRGSRSQWTAVAQVVNAYGRDNVMRYDWAQYYCYRAGECRDAGAAQRGLPAIPSIGLEVQW